MTDIAAIPAGFRAGGATGGSAGAPRLSIKAATSALVEMGRRIKMARRAASLSQAQLGEAVGVSRAAISQWEAGMVEPGLTRLRHAANHLGVDVGQLMTGTGETLESAGHAGRNDKTSSKKSPVQIEHHQLQAAASGVVAEVEIYPIENGILLKVKITGRLVAQLVTPNHTS